MTTVSLRRLFISALVVLLLNTEALARHITVSNVRVDLAPSTPLDLQQEYVKALNLLIHTCPAIRSYRGDIATAHIQIISAHSTVGGTDPMLGMYGWNRAMLLSFSAAKDPVNHLLGRLNKLAGGKFTYAWEFTMGAGRAPGVSLEEGVPSELCGGTNPKLITTPGLPSLNIPAGHETWYAIPALKRFSTLNQP